jgi:predicted nuclease of predicted toxin-antitoxin system
MKLLLDQGTPRTAAVLLRRVGLDAVHTGEIGMGEAIDEEILRRAGAEDRVVVTLDADFHAYLALTAATKPSVIRVRLEGLRAEAFADLLGRVIERCRGDLEHGAVVSVQQNRIRIRQLPIA